VHTNYSYTAQLDVPAGTYTVEVFHRKDSGEPAEFAGRATVTVPPDVNVISAEFKKGAERSAPFIL
jgi:hypothetical protein